MDREIELLLKSGKVKRWHTHDTIKCQTVAEHCYNGALILLRVIEVHNQNSMEKLSVERLVPKFLLHDVAEQYSSDVSESVKRDNPTLRDMLDDIEWQWREENLPSLKCYNDSISALERNILTFVDMVEALYFCLNEYQMGNKKMYQVIEEIYTALLNRKDKVSEEVWNVAMPSTLDLKTVSNV